MIGKRFRISRKRLRGVKRECKRDSNELKGNRKRLERDWLAGDCKGLNFVEKD